MWPCVPIVPAWCPKRFQRGGKWLTIEDGIDSLDHIACDLEKRALVLDWDQRPFRAVVHRDLQRLGLPAVVPMGVVTGRVDPDGEELPAALLTEHLAAIETVKSLQMEPALAGRFADGASLGGAPFLVG